jgi:SAM-dependent methyltransferase
MSYLAGGAPFFCERFSPSVPSGYDLELDEAVSEMALARGSLSGFCNVAGEPATFAVVDPNLRENVFADVSGSAMRHRIIACGISLGLFDTPLCSLRTSADMINERRQRVFLTETTTTFHRAVTALVDPDLLVSSEFFGPDHASGELVDGVRHEDLQRTSFPDNYLDLVLTSDVMEHVPDALAAEREIVRILRPGGHYCFTVPLDPYGQRDSIRAQLRPDGTIEYLADPMYHGDPLRPEGVLVFRIFSVREMTERFGALGATCTTYRMWSKTYGLIGPPGCWVHVVEKRCP